MVQMEMSNLCKQLADILGGKSKMENGVCEVDIDRKDLKPKILGVETNSPAAKGISFTFEMVSGTGMALILGEIVLLENEVTYVVTRLGNFGIPVTAIHNHWLFDRPRLMYIHITAKMEPVDFARKTASVLKEIMHQRYDY